jgi:hypothetical protein
MVAILLASGLLQQFGRDSIHAAFNRLGMSAPGYDSIQVPWLNLVFPHELFNYRFAIAFLIPELAESCQLMSRVFLGFPDQAAIILKMGNLC